MMSPSRAISAAALGRLSSRFAPPRSTPAPARTASRASVAAACRLAGASDIANATASTRIGVRVVFFGAGRLSVIINVYLWPDGPCRDNENGSQPNLHGLRLLS